MTYVFVKRSAEERLQAIEDKYDKRQMYHILPDGFMDYGGDIILENVGDPIPEGYTEVPPPNVPIWRHFWDGEDWIEGGSPPPPPENPEPPTPTIEMAMGLIQMLQQENANLAGQISALDYQLALANNSIGQNVSAIATLAQRISQLENDMLRVKGVVNID